MAFSENARVVLERRIARDIKTPQGVRKETPEEIFLRVASFIAKGPSTIESESYYRKAFYKMMIAQDFMPNSPCLVNAGTDNGQLSACFVLPVEDSMEGIFGTLKNMALIHKTGGGTGFNFSRLRPANTDVDTTLGIASGPVSFMKVYDAATEAVKQGGVRRGANMGILNITHPDIKEFINAKSDGVTLSNFNISVAVNDEFMEMISTGSRSSVLRLTHPKLAEDVYVSPFELWDMIIHNAWLTGDPGLIFIDRMNEPGSNPIPELGPIEATNPCGEQGLYSYDSCNLGSINLGNFVNNYEIDFGRLNETIKLCVLFLNNVIDLNCYPLPEINAVSKRTRRIGLGVMGWADMLAALKIDYDSVEALELAEDLGKFINEGAHNWAFNLGLFNSAFTTVAPTGTISIIADCSSGIEPYIGLEFTRSHYLDENDYTKRTELVSKSKYVAKTAHEISPLRHVEMQAAWQKNIDNAVSKTINLPNDATVEDVENAYLLAWRLGCKGITVYRDGSKSQQVLTVKGEYDEISSSRDDNVLDRDIYGSNGEESKRSRKTLPNDRDARTHRFTIAGQKGYVTVGKINEEPVEIFMHVSKRGSTINGLVDTIAMLCSLALQYNVPLEEIVNQLKGNKFEPSGLTQNPDIPTATSIVDYLGRLLELNYLTNTNDEVSVIPSGGTCLDCGGALWYDGGCEFCHACGWSKC